MSPLHDSGDSVDGFSPSLTVRFDVIRSAVPLLRVAGKLNSATARILFHIVDQELSNGTRVIVLDLSELSAIDVEAVPALVNVARRAAEDDIGLYVVATDGVGLQTLRTAGKLDLFDLYGDVDGAVAAMP